MTEKINQQWLLAARPKGLFKQSDFTWNETPLPALQEGEVLVRSVYLSLDPTMRGWASYDTYLPAVKIGSVMRGGAVGVVEASKNDSYAEGDIVQSMMGWQKYNITNGRGLTKLPKMPGISLDAHFGLFGHIGMTAYFGLLDITNPQEGETLVVTGAAGAVGSLVGQIGKIKGCRVVGIAGSDEKCAWLTDDLGFDAAINYKTQNVAAKLKEHCPNGIDIGFENVGGEIMDAILGQINKGARISLCGLISTYTTDKPTPGPYNLGNILVQRAKIEGFIVLDYNARAMEAIMPLAQWYKEGKMTYRTHVIEGIENAPEAINLLFTGGNRGKLVVKVSDE